MDDKDIKTILKKINEIEMIIDTVCNTSASRSLQDGDVEAIQYRLEIIKDRVSDQK
jgi:hypothetical protein